MSVMNWAPRKAGSWQVGRLRISYRLYIHKYTSSPDRWVFQPEILWDRK